VEPITQATLESFLQRLGQRTPCAGSLYLLGGSALSLLGNPRTTMDLDYTFEPESGSPEEFESAVKELAADMRLDVERVLLEEQIRNNPTWLWKSAGD
jgi:hypothetical protein